MKKIILTSFDDVKHQLILGPNCSFDWETTGLDYMKMEPVGISFYDGENAFYIDLWENPEQKQILGFLEHLFDTRLWIAHNAKFDIKCCRKFLGTEPSRIYCTFIASYILDENRESHGLKYLAEKDLGINASEIKGWDTAKDYGYHSKIWYQYCHNDAIWAYKLWQLQVPEIDDQELDHVLYDIEFPFIYVCVDMEVTGIKVDMDKLNELERKANSKLIELEDQMVELAGLKIFIQQRMFGLDPERKMSRNLRSPEQLKTILGRLGFKVKDVKAETIEKLKGKHPFIDCLIQYKQLRKLYDAYIIPTFDRIDSDGRIRCSFGIVKTGRTKCYDPNLQQLPRLNNSFKDIDYRSIFCAEPGNKLFGGDYSGQELRVLGEVSDDENIRTAFNNNYDLHLYTANFIFNLNLQDVDFRLGTKENEEAVKKYKSERYKAKNGVNFPVVYGSSEFGIAYNMGVSVEIAKDWRKKFFELYPGVKTALSDCRIDLEELGYVSDLMGRRRRFPGYKTLPMYAVGKKPSKTRCVRQAFNFKIQGFSADQVKIAAVKARSLGITVLLIIHDEIVSESGNPQQDVRTLKECMEHAVCLSVPFIADCKVGDRYSDLK